MRSDEVGRIEGPRLMPGDLVLLDDHLLIFIGSHDDEYVGYSFIDPKGRVWCKSWWHTGRVVSRSAEALG